MKKVIPVILGLIALGGSSARAQVALDSVRVAVKDTVALAKFYLAAFGMQEVSRIENPGGTEVFVNFGATVEKAKANKNPLIIVFHRDSDDVKDPIPHVIFVVEGYGQNGGCGQGRGWYDDGRAAPLQRLGDDPGVCVDAAGNRIELIQRP